MSVELYDGFWAFAIKRQELFYTSTTDDPVLQTYRFTNCYRAMDRVSQYLIKHVIGWAEFAKDELFRILLFKTFNKISTWEFLLDALGHEPFHYRGWCEDYDVVLKQHEGGYKLFAPAYRYASGQSSYGFTDKYRNYLRMIDDVVTRAKYILESPTYEQLYTRLWQTKMLGPFFAMQFATDLNYSELFQFDENDFVMPGPGCRRGVAKVCGCHFRDDDAILEALEKTVEGQHAYRFPVLPGHPLSLMDVQNLYCEYDKYLRMTKPELNSTGRGNRKPLTRPKQTYKPSPLGRMRWPDDFVFPKKWGM